VVKSLSKCHSPPFDPENESPLLTKKKKNLACGNEALQIEMYVIDSNYFWKIQI
jgi:hypothetical protein